MWEVIEIVQARDDEGLVIKRILRILGMEDG